MKYYYQFDTRTIYIVPKIYVVNGQAYVSYHWQGAEYAEICDRENNKEEVQE